MTDARARAAQLISALGLEVLPGESGWWRLVRESDVEVTAADGVTLPASNTIHFLLSPERPVNIWHVLESDDVHVLVEGGPVEYVLLPPAGPARREVMDQDSPLVVAPARTWTALRLSNPDGYAWIVTTVTPAWSPPRARIGLDDATRRRWVGTQPWLTPELVAELDDPEPR